MDIVYVHVHVHVLKVTVAVPCSRVRCYNVPDHYVPVCLKRPLVTTSLDSLPPVIRTSLLKFLI
jgi:hypothetical protein